MKRSNRFERNPKKTLFVVVFGVLVLTDIIMANLYRYVVHGKRQRVESTYRVASDIYHHDLAKKIHVEATRWGDKSYAVATDSLGFKSEKVKDTPMVSSKYRIVFIGDSFTEGIGIRYQDTFVGLIADVLLERDTEVLNAAVCSYSPIIYYRKIKYLLDRGLRFNELVVFIDISDIQDEAIYYEMSESGTVKTQRRVSNKVRALIKKNSIIAWYISKQRDLTINYKRSMWTIDESTFYNYGDIGLKRADNYMSQLHHLLRAKSIKLTIAVYPWPDQIVNNDLDSMQVEYWRKWAQDRQVDFLNYFPCFINQPSKNQVSGFDTLREYFIDGEVHWNEKGHELIAREYISFYNRQNAEITK